MSPFTNGGGVLAQSAHNTAEVQHMLFLNNDVCVKCKVNRHMVRGKKKKRYSVLLMQYIIYSFRVIVHDAWVNFITLLERGVQVSLL